MGLKFLSTADVKSEQDFQETKWWDFCEAVQDKGEFRALIYLLQSQSVTMNNKEPLNSIKAPNIIPRSKLNLSGQKHGVLMKQWMPPVDSCVQKHKLYAFYLI